MRFVDEFREAGRIEAALEQIRRAVVPGRRYRVMEVCGGHTHAIYRFGLHQLLPDEIVFLHGPGCPVCVLPMGRIDGGLALADRPEVIFAAFGDMMRVPGTHGSPLAHKARGADIRTVYSPLDALTLARNNPKRQVVFFAIGFETTSPSTALTLKRAWGLGLENFSVYCNHVLVVPAMRAVLEHPISTIDAFIGPGHVSTVIGTRPYREIAADYGTPVVVSGFEPLDLLQALILLIAQLNEGRAEVENQYTRAVREDGNLAAQAVLDEVFEVRPSFEWRGLGTIADSAVRLRSGFAPLDAEARFALPTVAAADPGEARCGDILVGAAQPNLCPLFGAGCTPELPVGAPMVSSEGACAAYFTYVHRRTVAAGHDDL